MHCCIIVILKLVVLSMYFAKTSVFLRLIQETRDQEEETRYLILEQSNYLCYKTICNKLYTYIYIYYTIVQYYIPLYTIINIQITNIQLYIPLYNMQYYTEQANFILGPTFTWRALCNHPCPSIRGPFVRPWSVFEYLKDGSLVFLKLCMKLGVNKVKSDTAGILKKNLNLGIKGD